VRLALAQYRELAAFAQFASDLDDATRKQLERGRRVTELMKQPQFAPLSVAEMAVSLFAANQGFLDDVDNAKILAFESGLHQYMRQQCGALMDKIETTKDLDKDGEAELTKAVAAFKQTWA
jgi:F-type H+-transporting ATPase subunit alpha